MAKKVGKRAGMVDIDVGFKIRQIRQQKRLTQKDVATKLGITSQQFQKYEQGINRICIERLVAVSNALEVDPKEILPGSKHDIKKEEALLDNEIFDCWQKLNNTQTKRLVFDLINALHDQEKLFKSI